MRGKIIKSISSFHYVDTGEQVYECKARGILKFKNKMVCVGDYVEIEVTDEKDNEGSIINVFERKNYLKRPVIANITQAILLFATKNPNPNLSLIDRFLILANRENVDILLLINKKDLDDSNIFSTILEKYKNLDITIRAINALEDDLCDIKELIKGHTSIVAGPSGSGKSTFINKIAGLSQKTGDVSNKIGRGRHTTRYVELLKLDDETYLADSPGFSSIDLNEFDEYELKNEFEEFLQYDYECKFSSNCIHINEPGCRVKEAVENGEISRLRYESYVQLQKEVSESRRNKY